MNGKWIIFSCFIWIVGSTFAQRAHLVIGGTIGFKDEFFLTPSFTTPAQFAEFHIYDISVFTRVSKRRLGLEIDLGFEKAGYYFVRFNADSKATESLTLNRVLSGVSGLFYLKKTSKHKVDVQLGCQNYFNCTPAVNLNANYAMRTWKCAARVGLNYTFKSFLSGVFYEQTLRNDYPFENPSAVFGLRLGVIY